MNFDLLKSPLTGSNLIEASAGTGKTYTIAGIFLRCLIQRRLSLSKILVVTFTDAATTELKERISDWIIKARQVTLSFNKVTNEEIKSLCDIDFIIELVSGQLKTFTQNEDILDVARNELLKHLNAAYANFDNASIHTIHAFCRKSLTEDPIVSKINPDIEIITDETELVDEIILDYYRNNIYPLPEQLLRYVTQRVPFEKFTQIIRQLPIEDNLHVIPEHSGTGTILDIEQNTSQTLIYLKELKEFWVDYRAEIIDFFFASDNTNKSTYNKKLRSNLVSFMDSESHPNEYLQQKLIYFHDSNIKLKKNGEKPQLIEKFSEIFERYSVSFHKQKVLFEEITNNLQRNFISYFKRVSVARMLNRAEISYDQLIVQMNRLICDTNNTAFLESLREKYSFALIDEFQDTDPVQYNIFKTIFMPESGSYPIFLIGDPKQAIYKFRGADIFAYIRASKQVEHTYTLSTNYRSSKGIVESINFLFSHREKPFIYDQLTYSNCNANSSVSSEIIDIRENFTPFTLDFYENTRSNTDKVPGKNEIRQLLLYQCSESIAKLLNDSRDGRILLKDRRIKPSDIAVLVRTNKDAIEISSMLKRVNVPSVLLRSSSVYKTDEAIDLYKLMSSVVKFGNHKHLFAALATPLLGYNAEDISLLEDNSQEIEKVYQRWLRYNQIWRTNGFIAMFTEMDRTEGIRNRCISYNNSMRMISNISHLSELISTFEIQHSNTPEDVINWLFEKIYISDSTEEEMMRLETDDESVRILTVHKSKGLEFPIVYCPFLLYDLNKYSKKPPFVFHDKDNDYKTTFVLETIQDSPYLETKKLVEETIAEGLRLLYVAFTRAKYACHVSVASGTNINENALYYLMTKYDYEKCSNEPITNDSIKEILHNLQREINIAGYSEFFRVNRKEILSGNCYDEETEQFTITKPEPIGISSLKSSWYNTSYSAIARMGNLSYNSSDLISLFPTRDEPDYEDTDEQDSKDIFGFPKGSNAGSCLHEMFEKIDYNNFENQGEFVCSILNSYSISTEWGNVAIKMIANVLNKGIKTEHEMFKLVQTSQRKRINELEFFFDTPKIDLHKIADILSESRSTLLCEYSVELNKKFELDYSIVHGFIDMFFEFDGKYYIVDWKSNYLGDKLEDYTFDSMKKAMFEHHYILQFLIYIIAIDRYLKFKSKDYDYETDFGGILYIFLRGVDMDGSTNNGIFYFKPESELIDRIKEEMSH